jgi:hypothetical protein
MSDSVVEGADPQTEPVKDSRSANSVFPSSIVFAMMYLCFVLASAIVANAGH